MSEKTNTNADDSNIKKLLSAIRKEQQKINQHEGEVIAAHLRLGHHLSELRTLAKRNWGEQLRAVGISPRVASRYLKIAEHWSREIGLPESDLLPRLPPDLLKLEWLCRVPKAQLGGLLDKLDCKKATRPQVIAAVREVLGEAAPSKDEEDVEKYVARFISRMASVVERLRDTFPEPEQLAHARQLVAAGLQKLHATCVSLGNHKPYAT